MDQITNQTLYQSMSAMVSGQAIAGQLAAAVTKDDSKFQELLERAQNPQDVELPQPAQKKPAGQETKEPPKTEAKETTETTQEQETVQTVPGQEQELRRLIESGILTPAETVVYSESVPVSNEAVPAETEAGGTVIPVTQTVLPAGEATAQTAAEPAAQAAEQAAVRTETAAPETGREEAGTDTVQAAQVQTQPQDKAEPKVQRHAEPQTQTRDTDTGGEGNIQVTQAAAQPQRLFRDVEAAPIKVGEAPVMEQSGGTPPVEVQVGAQLAQALSQGESRVELQLNPESLGKVTVEIIQSTSGVLHIALSAENSQTRGLLEKHAVNIQTMLGREQEVQVEVRQPEESHQSQQHSYDGHSGNQQQEQQERRQQHPHRTEDFLQQLRLGLIPMDS